MKKKNLIVITICLILLVFAGCSGSTAYKPEPSTKAEWTPDPNNTGYCVSFDNMLVFDTFESFLYDIKNDLLPERDEKFLPKRDNVAFDVMNDKEQLIFPMQKNKIYELEKIKYDQPNGAYYSFYFLFDEYEIAAAIAYDEGDLFVSINDYAEYVKAHTGVRLKTVEIINDSLLTEHEDGTEIAIEWFDNGIFFFFAVRSQDRNTQTVDRDTFFEIFDNFTYVDYAAAEREVLQQAAD